MARPALSASRAADIISFMAGHPGRMFTMAEVIRATNINVGSCFAVLSSLVQNGFLTRDEAQKSYGLGPAMVAAGLSALASHPLIDQCMSAAKALAEEFDAAALITTRLGEELLALFSAESPSGRRFDMLPGQRTALIPPVGGLLMAWADTTEIDRWIADATPSAENAARWRGSLTRARQRGYLISLRDARKATFADMLARLAEEPSMAARSSRTPDVVHEFGWDFLVLDTIVADETYNVSSIAVPIFERRDRPPLSLSIGSFGRELRGSEVTAIIERIQAVCMALLEDRLRA